MKIKIQKTVDGTYDILIEKPKENVYSDYYVFRNEKNVCAAKQTVEILKTISKPLSNY